MSAEERLKSPLIGQRLSLITVVLMAQALSASISSSEAKAQESAQSAISIAESQRLRNFTELTSLENIKQSEKRVNELIKAALDYSPAVRESYYNDLAAVQDVEAAKGLRMPQVIVTAQSLYSDGDMASALKATGKPSLVLSAQYALYDWGRNTANISGKEQAREATLARKEQIRRQVAVEVTTTCLELSKQRALLTANNEYLQKLKRLQDMLAKIVAEDAGRSAELLQVRSRLLQGESQAELVRSRVREIEIRLERVLGQQKSLMCTDIGSSLMRRPSDDGILEHIKNHPQIAALEAEYQQTLRGIEQISAARKPQVALRAEHTPIAASINNNYQQVVTIAATVPLYDGASLQSSEKAAFERANSASERVDTARNQLSSDLRERAKFADANIQRASEFVNLLAINERVRQDFFLQWSALGRRTLFELLAIEAEQLTLQSGYFSALYDGMIGIAYVSGQIGRLTEELR